MDEKDFELLEVLDETRNITHAADKLYMTQSALSKRIKSMEQELDWVRVFYVIRMQAEGLMDRE
jgi:DNA-binding transcriptional LysR family regulator